MLLWEGLNMVCCFNCKHAIIYSPTETDPEEVVCRNEVEQLQTPDGKDCYGWEPLTEVRA